MKTKRSAQSSGLKLLIYDDSCRSEWGVAGLTHSWIVGEKIYRKLGHIDASLGARSWEEALSWLNTYEPDRTIDEIQYWGHGKWGGARLNGLYWNTEAYQEHHRLYAPLLALSHRLHPTSLLWFRTCETFGGTAGADFAEQTADFLGCSVAGHTYVIGPWQSGLHVLRPGMRAGWSQSEGLKQGTPLHPEQAHRSMPWHKGSIFCLSNACERDYT